jgi:hypothetical protein
MMICETEYHVIDAALAVSLILAFDLDANHWPQGFSA